MRDMDINVAINSEVTKTFTKYCRNNGFMARNVLKYIIEHREIIDEVCCNILKSEEEYMRAILYQHKMKGLPKNNATPYALKNVRSDLSLKEILKQNGITVVFFFCYLAVNPIEIDFICNKIPDELKMKKYQ